MSISSRHHYIPKFMIKNFCDSDGLLYVYNKEKKKILDKRLAPKSIFFENNRNTTLIEGLEVDQIESLYSLLDNIISPDYNRILKDKSELNPETLTSLIILTYLLRWRVPNSDSNFNFIKNDLTSEDLSYNIQIKDKNLNIDYDAINFIENSEIFIEIKRILLAISPLLNIKHLSGIYNNCFIMENNYFPSLIGDCAVIYEQEKFNVLDNFVLPLSSYETFIYKKETTKNVRSFKFYIQRDLNIFHSSSKYVGCKSLRHLQNIVEMHNRFEKENKLEYIQRFLFDEIL